VVRATSETGVWDEAVLAPLGPPDAPGTVRDLATVDARRARSGADPRLAIEQRDGSPGPTAAEALTRVPKYALVARRYRRVA
jgi:hypothetical protein